MIDGGIVSKPLILLTNDDGIYAQGILAAVLWWATFGPTGRR